jgi:hypothetical protein
LRIGGREFVLSKPGIREATERYNARLAAWVENGETLPEGFTLEPKNKPKPIQEKLLEPINGPTDIVTIADLLAVTLAEVGAGKTKQPLRTKSCWWRLRKIAAVLEPPTMPVSDGSC